MKRIRIYGLSALLFLGIWISSCKENEIYPDVPFLKFKSYYFVTEGSELGADTLVGVVFSYKDGDGDIGLDETYNYPPYDTTSFYYNNIFIDYLEYRNGNFVPYILPNTTDTFKVVARIGILTPEGKHKAIRGDIDYQFYPPKNPDQPRADTIKLKIRIYDRALHESNTIESPVIVLPR